MYTHTHTHTPTTTTQGTLFRTNSYFTKSVNIYLRMIALPYLYETVSPIIKEVLSLIEEDKITVELDPSRMKQGDDRDLNRWVLLGLTQKVLCV